MIPSESSVLYESLKMTVYFSRYRVKCASKKAAHSPILCQLILCYYRKRLLHENFLNRSSKRFQLVDFKWQFIFTVLAFIQSAIVNFGHQRRQFWAIMFRTLMQLENQSFTKISHLLK